MLIALTFEFASGRMSEELLELEEKIRKLFEPLLSENRICIIPPSGSFMLGEDWSDDMTHDFIKAVDVNENGALELGEFQQLCGNMILDDSHDRLLFECGSQHLLSESRICILRCRWSL